jgi:hypothetical protein
MPKAAVTQAEQQQAERTALTPDQRKEQVTALRAASDTPQAFKAALEEAGYVLAKGDKRGLVIVDGQGEVYSLSRQVTDLKSKDFKAFMAPLPEAALPGVTEAKAQQQETALKAPAEARKQGVEASKFLAPQAPQKTEAPAQAPRDEAREALEKAIAERASREADQLRTRQQNELRQFDNVFAVELNEKLRSFDALQQAARDQIERDYQKKTGLISALHDRLNPDRARQREDQRRQEMEQLRQTQDNERRNYLAEQNREHRHDVEDLRDRHAQQLREQGNQVDRDRARYLREIKEADRIRQDVEEDRREREKLDSLREGPKPPTLGKT